MSIFLNRIIRLAAQKVAANPKVRSAAARAAREAAGEAKVIARDKNKARAAGRSVRRMLGKLRDDGGGS